MSVFFGEESVVVSEVQQLIRDGGLMTPQELETASIGWNDPVGAQDGPGFVDFLVRQGYLTDFQGKALKAGVSGPYRLGPYLVSDRIVAGRLGNVFRARHEEFQQPVSLKIFPSSVSKDEALAKQLARETRVAVRVNHANVVRTYQIGCVADTIFLAIEDLRGETLSERLSKVGRLEVLATCQMIREAALGLAHLHGLEILHCDLQPSNLWITDQGRIKIKEFSASLDALETVDEESDDEEIQGNLDYLAPEQGVSLEWADPRSDLYGLGCIFFHCLTGETVFPSRNPVRKMLQHALQLPPDVRDLVPEIPGEVADIVSTLLAKDKEDRYQRAEDLVWALEQAIGEEIKQEIVAEEISEGFLTWAKSSHPEEGQQLHSVLAEPEFLTFLDSLPVEEPGKTVPRNE